MNPDCEKNGSGHPLEGKIEAWLAAKIVADKIKVVGDGRHFKATIVSDEFAGLSLVARHRLVYAALGDNMEHIHALALRTLTPEEVN